MNAMIELLGPEAVNRLGWVLVHFLWQGAAVAVVLLAALRVGVRWSARARYVACYASLVVSAMLPAATWVWLTPWNAPAIAHNAAIVTTPASGAASPHWPAITDSTEQRSTIEASTTARFNDLTPLIAATWLIGVALLGAYRAGGWMYVQYLRRHGRAADDANLHRQLGRLCGSLRVRRVVRILHCPRIDSPAVVGVIRPVILLPLACALQLSPAQLEAILAHELAHVRRHDYLLNLIQTAIETLLFFHPAVWWMSRRIRIEREHATDDLALRATDNDRAAYADALAALEELRYATPPAPALAARGGPLLARVRRVLGAPAQVSERDTWWPAAAVAVLALTCVVGVCSRAVASRQPSSQPAKAATITCVDTDGRPVAGAEVFLRGSFKEGDTWRRIAPPPIKTDERGVARFANLSAASADAGGLDVYARVPGELAGIQYQTATVVDGRPWDEPFKLVMHPTRVLPVRVTDLPPSAKMSALRARVVRLNNLLVDGPGRGGQFAPVIWLSDPTSWPETFEYAVGDDGAFEVRDVPANASVTIVVEGPGIATAFISYHPKAPGAGNELTAALAPEAVIEGSVIYDDFPRRGAGNVEIRCTYQPHSPAGRADGGMPLFTRADADGRFQFRGLHQGIYSLKVLDMPEGYATAPAHVRIEQGQTVDDLKIRLDRGVIVRGTVVAAEGVQPLGGATIWASLADTLGIESEVTRSEPTDAQGRFAIRLPKGKLDLAVSPPEGFDRGQRVTLEIDSPADELPELLFKLGPWKPQQWEIEEARVRGARSALRGRVVDSQGKPLAGVRVHCKKPHPTTGELWVHMSGITKVDGSYEFAALNADVEHVVAVPLWSTTEAESKRVKLQANQTTELPELVVSPRPVVSEVAGTVVDVKGSPIRDAWVSIDLVANVRTGADGAFRINLYDAQAPVDLEVTAETYQRKVHRGIAPGTRDAKLVMQPKVPGSSEY